MLTFKEFYKTQMSDSWCMYVYATIMIALSKFLYWANVETVPYLHDTWVDKFFSGFSILLVAVATCAVLIITFHPVFAYLSYKSDVRNAIAHVHFEGALKKAMNDFAKSIRDKKPLETDAKILLKEIQVHAMLKWELCNIQIKLQGILEGMELEKIVRVYHVSDLNSQYFVLKVDDKTFTRLDDQID